MVIIVVDMFGTVPKGLENEMEELEISQRIKATQTKKWLKSVRILRRVPYTLGDLLVLKLLKAHQLMLL